MNEYIYLSLLLKANRADFQDELSALLRAISVDHDRSESEVEKDFDFMAYELKHNGLFSDTWEDFYPGIKPHIRVK